MELWGKPKPSPSPIKYQLLVEYGIITSHFISQTLVDYDTNPQELYITNLNGKVSHTPSADAFMSYSAARSHSRFIVITSSKATYNNRLMRKPLQKHYKALPTS